MCFKDGPLSLVLLQRHRVHAALHEYPAPPAWAMQATDLAEALDDQGWDLRVAVWLAAELCRTTITSLSAFSACGIYVSSALPGSAT